MVFEKFIFCLYGGVKLTKVWGLGVKNIAVTKIAKTEI